jgi:hypothetical protein
MRGTVRVLAVAARALPPETQQGVAATVPALSQLEAAASAEATQAEEAASFAEAALAAAGEHDASRAHSAALSALAPIEALRQAHAATEKAAADLIHRVQAIPLPNRPAPSSSLLRGNAGRSLPHEHEIVRARAAAEARWAACRSVAPAPPQAPSAP